MVKIILLALLLSGCAIDINGTHIVKHGQKRVACTQESADLIECRSK